MPLDNCPDCGAERTNGLCPRCPVTLGIDGAGLARSEPGDTRDFPPGPGSVLETIGASFGGVPRVMLRDTAVVEEPSPIYRAVNGDEPSIRYRIYGEIARGGMGAVLKGRDPDLGRDVAIKVLREDHQDNGDMVRRFVEEAQIGGQLQHPGVVPIYELGTFADHRPFFSMKLVKGQTLADLLAARSAPADDLPRFLSIYLAMAQTMAYAHTRGVIHRDLKPSNVMVGSFGEVQVMDWGLAKLLPGGGVAGDAQASKEPPEEAPIATARSGSDAALSHDGSVMGTPSYMAPEQARGANARINERADVFALGSILCEILTGTPAFKGRTSIEILRKAGLGDTSDALGRLGACGAEPELIALAKDCLTVEPEDRLPNAGLVADRVTAYLAGVQERVQAAERERAVAVARAIEERRRRKVQLALAASVLAFTTLGGLSTTYYLQQRAAQAAATDRVVGQAVTLRDQAVAHPEDLSRWQVALAAVEQADAVGDRRANDRLLALRTEIQAGLDAAQRDRTLLDRLVDIRSAQADDWDGSGTDAAYGNAFREAEIDVAGLPPADAGAKIRARPPSVTSALAVAIDDWAALRRGVRTDAAGAARLSETAGATDPDPWRNELRRALDLSDKTARLAGLLALEKTAKLDELGAISLELLGAGLDHAGDSARAEAVLRLAQRRHPRDVWVNHSLARVLEKRARRDEAIRFYTAARSIRPETAHMLAHALASRGDSDEAIDVFRDLTELRPGNAWHLTCLGLALEGKGLSGEAGKTLEDAVTAGREAIRLMPKYAQAHANLGIALAHLGKLDLAIAEYHTAITLQPERTEVRRNLGEALVRQGKIDLAVAEYRTAIRLKPDFAEAHGELGTVFFDHLRDYPAAESEFRTAIKLKPDGAEAHANLGFALERQGKLDLAIIEYQAAIRLRPDMAQAHQSLGVALCEAKHEYAAAEIEFRTAIRLKPDDFGPNYCPHYWLGNVLGRQGKVDLAVAEYRTAIRLQPDSAEAHSNLGLALEKQRKLDLAISEFRTAIRLKPDLFEAHLSLGALFCDRLRDYPAAESEFRTAIGLKPDADGAHANLGIALRGQGKFDLAVTEFSTATRLKPDNASHHMNLGALLCDRLRDYPAAESEFRAATRLKPDDAGAHANLASALRGQGKLDLAIAELNTAVRLKPDDAGIHRLLGAVLAQQGKFDLGIAELRTAIRLKPDDAEIHCELGFVFQEQGDYERAVEMFRKGHELGSRRTDWRYPSAQWVADAERKLAGAKRLSAIVRGEDNPADNAERLSFAQLAYDRKHFAVGVRLWAEALQSDPKLGDDRRAVYRYNAACAAALAAAGQGEDKPPRDDTAKAKLRGQALEWLKAELAAWAKLLESSPPQARAGVAKALQHWKQDADLAGIRDAETVAKLPADEQKAWRTFWTDVDSLLKRAATKTATETKPKGAVQLRDGETRSVWADYSLIGKISTLRNSIG